MEIFQVFRFRRLLPLLVMAVFCVLCKSDAQALTPTSARGYINAMNKSEYEYLGNNPWNDGTHAVDTRNAIQAAINYARTKRKVLFFPEGIYLIDDKLTCHTLMTYKDPDQLCNVLVGSTQGARPVIKLVPNANGYDKPGSPKPMLEFKNFNDENPTLEAEASHYYQMLRGIDLDCGGSTNPGAYGVYFNAAQNSSIENVRVNATGAYAGFVGLPGRSWGVVNIEVEGGQYGVDTSIAPSAGPVIAGAVFRNQTTAAVRYAGFVPLVMAGFKIETATNKAAITTIASAQTNAHCINLIDGEITFAAAPAIAAIDNSSGKNLYLRNVSVTVTGSSGSHKLVKSGGQTLNGSGTWKRIDEYSYCDQTSQTINGVVRRSWNLLDGQPDNVSLPVAAITSSAPVPPEDLVLRHRWASLPSFEDSDCVDAADHGILPGNVSSTAFQSVIAGHRKIFLRPGLYSLNGTVTLRNDTVLFGPARHLTQITTQSTWKPVAETPIFTTEPDVNATTYIGDLTMGFRVSLSDKDNSWFNMLDWRAGANSMVHTGGPFTIPHTGGNADTKARSLLKVSESGGGRWFFPGCHEGKGMTNPSFRIFKALNTAQPLWIYGLNLEHATCETYAELSGSKFRIYGVKSEDSSVPNPIVTFNNATNAAMFGHGALRNAPGLNQGSDEINGNSNKILMTHIVPQSVGTQANGYTLADNTQGTLAGVAYPACISLFKRGDVTAIDDAEMNHAHIGYASVPTGWTSLDVGNVGRKGSAGYGSGIYTVRGSGADIWSTADQFGYLFQTKDGNCEISARVLTQQNTGQFAKAGIMIRDSIDADSPSAQILVVGSNGNRFHYRTNTASVTLNSGDNDNTQTPLWIKLKRNGEVFTAYRSGDGINWTQVGSPVRIPMNPSVLIGLCVSSYNNATLNTATFDNVEVRTLPQTEALSWRNYSTD